MITYKKENMWKKKNVDFTQVEEGIVEYLHVFCRKMCNDQIEYMSLETNTMVSVGTSMKSLE
jgi:hypothetical protein